MSTAHKTDEEKIEYFDSPEIFEQKVEQLAQMVKSSKYFVAFTGAGISTSTGIPDFRSGVNTVLKTGPGAWEKIAQKVENNVRVKVLSAVPSSTHMSLVELQKKNILKFLISQNTDGLIRRSGFSLSHLAELHGNTNLEKCSRCQKQYLRDYRTRTAQQSKDHSTDRYCDDGNCRGQLHDSIINFGENLPEKELFNGFFHSEKSDLHLVLGSSLRVTPAAKMPKTTLNKGGKLVIVNLQKTPFDEICDLRINAMCDDVMILLMKKLSFDIPQFILERRAVVNKLSNKSIDISGEDSEGSPYHIFKSVILETNGNYPQTIEGPPYNFHYGNSTECTVVLSFFQHYQEPSYSLNINLNDLQFNKKVVYLMRFSVAEGRWIECSKL